MTRQDVRANEILAPGLMSHGWRKPDPLTSVRCTESLPPRLKFGEMDLVEVYLKRCITAGAWDVERRGQGHYF